jgi:hypothetical protein
MPKITKKSLSVTKYFISPLNIEALSDRVMTYDPSLGILTQLLTRQSDSDCSFSHQEKAIQWQMRS